MSVSLRANEPDALPIAMRTQDFAICYIEYVGFKNPDRIRMCILSALYTKELKHVQCNFHTCKLS